jgi:hypothetical protein
LGFDIIFVWLENIYGNPKRGVEVEDSQKGEKVGS